MLATVALGLLAVTAGAGFQPLGDPLNDAALQMFDVNVVNDAGQPLVVWDNSPPSGEPIQVHAKRFDGTSWVAAGDALNVDPTRAAYESELLARAQELAAGIAAQPFLTRRYGRLVCVDRMRRVMQEGLGTGLLAEALAAVDHWPEAGTMAR